MIRGIVILSAMCLMGGCATAPSQNYSYQPLPPVPELSPAAQFFLSNRAQNMARYMRQYKNKLPVQFVSIQDHCVPKSGSASARSMDKQLQCPLWSAFHYRDTHGTVEAAKSMQAWMDAQTRNQQSQSSPQQQPPKVASPSQQSRSLH